MCLGTKLEEDCCICYSSWKFALCRVSGWGEGRAASPQAEKMAACMERSRDKYVSTLGIVGATVILPLVTLWGKDV